MNVTPPRRTSITTRLLYSCSWLRLHFLTIHECTLPPPTAPPFQADPVRCASQVVDRVGLLVPVTYVGSAAVTLLALLYAVLPKLMRSKAKAM